MNQEYFKKLVDLLGGITELPISYFIYDKKDNKVAENRSPDLRYHDDEEESILCALASLRKYPNLYPESASDSEGRYYYAFPILNKDEDYRYALVCVGSSVHIERMYHAYVLTTELYQLM